MAVFNCWLANVLVHLRILCIFLPKHISNDVLAESINAGFESFIITLALHVILSLMRRVSTLRLRLRPDETSWLHGSD